MEAEDPVTPGMVVAADGLALELRAWLESRDQADAVLLTALLYEMVRIVARNAPTEEGAIASVHEFLMSGARAQIRRFGVWRHHP